ncbi:MAG: type II secretion system protein M [Gammaproteobacteria bacterium]|nr:type II secretion system protein M [Gammaproteobacteria bacterium]
MKIPAALAQLKPREQAMLLGGGAALIIMMIYFLAWQPFKNSTDRLRQTTADQQTLLQWMQKSALEAKSLQGSAPTRRKNSSGKSLLTLIDQTAKSGKLGSALKRVEPSGSDKVRIRLQEASFDDMVRWLTRIKRDYGITVISTSIDSNADGSGGRVNVRLTLQGAKQ